jgi:hypothetical protein
MKKLILLLILVTFISCSSDEGSSNNSFNPPAWIQGKWTNSTLGTPLGYKFANNDVCTTIYGIDTCFKSTNDLMGPSGAYINIVEQITDTEYKLEYTLASTTFNYRFVKVSATQIKELINDPSGSLLYTKQ